MKRTSRYGSGLLLSLAILGATARADEPGVVYTMDNAAAGNHVLAFQRAENGELVSAGSFATGGTGVGVGLSSQGSVVLSRDGRWLFVCNSGSGEVSVLSASENGLTLTDKVSSGGRMPVSLAFRHNLLYVLNAGGGVGDADNITAFVFADGKLLALPNSTRGLSASNTGPAQVSFTRDGDSIVVTERLTSLIDIFAAGDNGLTETRNAFQSIGTTPFGFDVSREDRLFISEAQNSTASSYVLGRDANLEVITGSAPTGQKAACWLVASHNGRFIYTANAGSGTISGFSVGHDGSLHLLNPGGITGVTGPGSHPVDMAENLDGRFLYSLANGNGTIVGFRVKPNGELDPLAVVNGIPTSAAGLAAR